jgi:hypothetical protein
MTVHEVTAYEFLKNHRRSIKFDDVEISGLFQRGRVTMNDMVYIHASAACSLDLMHAMLMKSITIDLVWIHYAEPSDFAVLAAAHMKVSSFHELLQVLEQTMTRRPRLIFLYDGVQLLKGFAIPKLEKLIKRMSESHIALITNCPNVAELATQKICK